MLARRAVITELIDRCGGWEEGKGGKGLGQHRIQKIFRADADGDVRAEILTSMIHEGGDVVDHRWVNVDDFLASWNDGPTKKSIVGFVDRVTKAGGMDYVAPEERIATFDNDGALWSERPYPFQIAFALDQVKAMAPQHPEWQDKEPFKSVLAGDLKGIFSGGYHALIEIAAATHSGMTTDEFEAQARKWLATKRHPQTNKLFTEMVFHPMLELLSYLRANGFKTFIVSGGGVEFMRAFAEITYGVPPRR